MSIMKYFETLFLRLLKILNIYRSNFKTGINKGRPFISDLRNNFLEIGGKTLLFGFIFSF